MPCDSVAVVRCRLEADVPSEILSSPIAVDGFIRWLRTNAEARITYHTKDLLVATVGKFVVEVSRTSITVKPISSWDSAAADEFSLEVATFAKSLAQASVQERLAQSIRKRYVVESDQVDARGFRALTIQL